MTDQRIDPLSPGSFELDGQDVSSPRATPFCAPPPVRAITFRTCAGSPSSPQMVRAASAQSRSTAAPVPPAPSLASAGQEVQSNTDELNAQRKTLLQMLFVEGNHFCPSCEKSGDCLLQATAYEVGMTGPHFEELYPNRAVDASHPDVLLDLNRCILCGLCVRASATVDGKNVFAIDGHGIDTRLIVNSPSGLLGDSAIATQRLRSPHLPRGRHTAQTPGFCHTDWSTPF
jgi:[NiFe] hydrogenase diaphorase moiety small subunit